MMIVYVLARVAMILFLLWAADRHAEGIFPELRWLVFLTGLTGAGLGARFRQYGWLATLAVVAFLYNPILPLDLGRSGWATIDYVTALLLLISIPTLRRR